ncbi:MAG: carbonic anhydrase [Pyrinomonadaceae bacterium]
MKQLISKLPVFLLLFLLAFSVSMSVSCSKAAANEDSKAEESDDSEDEEDSEPKKKKESHDDEDADKEESSDDEKAKHSEDEKKGDSAKKKSHGDDEKGESVDVTKLWQELMAGNGRFTAGKHTTGQLVNARKSLVKGQKPQVIVISCSDSRVPPEIVFDKNLGELFVIRTAGNVADPIALGSIEYAAEHLHSKMLVVLGHESCGAVAATLSGDKMPTKNLNAIVSAIKPSFEDAEECAPGGPGGIRCIKLNVTHSSKEIVANSPILKELVGDGSLHIVKAYYEMESGKVVRF